MIGIALAGWLAAGCVEVEGGAVELSWTLRNFEGTDRLECPDANVGQIRLCWVPIADGGIGAETAECTIVRTETGFRELFRTFACSDNGGVTRFELPTGDNALFIRPICSGGQPPTGDFQVPPPIVRSVARGEVVTLNQLLVVLDDDCSDGSCTCPPPAE